MMYIAIGFMFLFGLAFFNLILFGLFYKEKPIDKLQYYEKDYLIKEKVESHKKKKVSFLKRLARLVPNPKIKRKRTKRIEEELIKADMPITVEELFVVKMLSSTIFSFLTYAIVQDVIITLIVLVSIWNIPSLVISKRKKERVKHFNEQINEGIMLISNSLKAGYSFLQAISVVAEETTDPIAKEFKKLLKEMSLGISTEDAMRGMLTRVDSDDLKLIVNAILIQKDIGGNLSEILDNISDTIRERQKIKNELKTLTAQGKLSGIIIVLIPVFLGLAIYVFNREYIVLLFTTKVGLAMIISALVNQFIGLVIIRKIIKVEM